jgi:hypothetical protein
VTYVDICKEVAEKRMTLEEATYILERRDRMEKITERLVTIALCMALLVLAAVMFRMK